MDMAKNVSSKVNIFLNQSMVQMSIVGSVLFFILASPTVFSLVDRITQRVGKSVGVDIRLNSNMLLFVHALVFGVLFYLSVTFILEPLLKR
tara:strand:+ start:4728 stop:5000 length:273 start_codon:yes stop_codon:yes gene_type:complete